MSKPPASHGPKPEWAEPVWRCDWAKALTRETRAPASYRCIGVAVLGLAHADYGGAYASHNVIGEFVGYSARTVGPAMRWLVAEGWYSESSRHGDTTVYEPRMPPRARELLSKRRKPASDPSATKPRKPFSDVPGSQRDQGRKSASEVGRKPASDAPRKPAADNTQLGTQLGSQRASDSPAIAYESESSAPSGATFEFEGREPADSATGADSEKNKLNGSAQNSEAGENSKAESTARDGFAVGKWVVCEGKLCEIVGPLRDDGQMLLRFPGGWRERAYPEECEPADPPPPPAPLPPREDDYPGELADEMRF